MSSESSPALKRDGVKPPTLTVKEKKELASYAHSLGKKLKSQLVGKSGVTASVAASFIENLESNELLKVISYSFVTYYILENKILVVQLVPSWGLRVYAKVEGFCCASLKLICCLLKRVSALQVSLCQICHRNGFKIVQSLILFFFVTEMFTF